MRIIRLPFLIIMALALFGCINQSFTQGIPFDEAHISDINKDVTTKAQIFDWFGKPFSKTVSGTNAETWNYMYLEQNSKIKNYVFATDHEFERNLKNLDIFFKDDVVINYIFTDKSYP